MHAFQQTFQSWSQPVLASKSGGAAKSHNMLGPFGAQSVTYYANVRMDIHP
jgi:hypothetical protein